MSTVGAAVPRRSRESLGTARSSPAISAVSRPAVGVAECLDVSPSDSSQAIFACGAGGRFRLLSDARLHNRVAASRKGRGSRPESPSTEDACLRCWLNSDSPHGDGAARHWGRSHRTLVSARARDETPRRTADSFGGSVPKGEQGLRRMRHGKSGRGQSCLSLVLTGSDYSSFMNSFLSESSLGSKIQCMKCAATAACWQQK